MQIVTGESGRVNNKEGNNGDRLLVRNIVVSFVTFGSSVPHGLVVRRGYCIGTLETVCLES